MLIKVRQSGFHPTESVKMTDKTDFKSVSGTSNISDSISIYSLDSPTGNSNGKNLYKQTPTILSHT